MMDYTDSFFCFLRIADGMNELTIEKNRPFFYDIFLSLLYAFKKKSYTHFNTIVDKLETTWAISFFKLVCSD